MLFWLSETGKIWGFHAFWSCSVNFPHYGNPLAWNWSYLGFLGIIWRTCVSKCRGEGGGIFPTLCVECCLVYNSTGLCTTSLHAESWDVRLQGKIELQMLNNRGSWLLHYSLQGAFQKHLNLRALKISMLYKNHIFQCIIVCVRYFVWNFKGYLWNSTQDILPIPWKM